METLRLITINDCDNGTCGVSHIGKFASCRDEALWELALNDAEETTGDVDWDIRMSLLVVKHAEVVVRNGFAVAAWAGGYLVMESSGGSVLVSHYVDAEDAKIEFESIRARYVEFLNHEDTHPDW